MLGTVNAELKLVIAGNHDLELDGPYWTSLRNEDGNLEDPNDRDEAVALMKGSYAAAEAGVVFLDEWTFSFKLKSGAVSEIYASPYTPAFGDWAFAYARDEDRFSGPGQFGVGIASMAINPIPSDVDIVMTHGPAKEILDFCPQGHVGCD
ncbi:MAG: hypothetical protein Q9219_004901 [cf. Caloplaca sp. 3 TL-2023]